MSEARPQRQERPAHGPCDILTTDERPSRRMEGRLEKLAIDPPLACRASLARSSLVCMAICCPVDWPVAQSKPDQQRRHTRARSFHRRVSVHGWASQRGCFGIGSVGCVVGAQAGMRHSFRSRDCFVAAQTGQADSFQRRTHWTRLSAHTSLSGLACPLPSRRPAPSRTPIPTPPCRPPAATRPRWTPSFR